jgi:hypothetical protein
VAAVAILGAGRAQKKRQGEFRLPPEVGGTGRARVLLDAGTPLHFLNPLKRAKPMIAAILGKCRDCTSQAWNGRNWMNCDVCTASRPAMPETFLTPKWSRGASMRKLCVAVGLALCSGSALAADFGVGISARSDDGFLYVPVNITSSLRIEPSVRYISNEQTFTQTFSEDSQETKQWELGVGVFGLKKVADAAHIYYGARFAYVDVQSTTVGEGSFGLPVYGKTDQDGYRIGPTVGFEYLFGGHFSVGGEASYMFLDVDGESSSRIGNGLSQSTLKTEQKTNGTQTRLIFRYMF